MAVARYRMICLVLIYFILKYFRMLFFSKAISYIFYIVVIDEAPVSDFVLKGRHDVPYVHIHVTRCRLAVVVQQGGHC